MKKTLLILVGAILINLLLIAFVVYPFIQKIKQSSKELVLAKQEAASTQEHGRALQQIEREYQSIESDVEKADGLFVNSKAPITFIKFLEQLAQNQGLNIEISLSSAKKIKGDTWPSMVFQLSLTGSSDNCVKFIEKIQSSDYLIEVNNATLRNSSGEGQEFSTGNTSLSLVIKVFTN